MGVYEFYCIRGRYKNNLMIGLRYRRIDIDSTVALFTVVFQIHSVLLLLLIGIHSLYI
jgi:hypothetical protein